MIPEPPHVVAEGSSLLTVPVLEGMFMVLMLVFERSFGDPKISLNLFCCKQSDFCFTYDLLGLMFHRNQLHAMGTYLKVFSGSYSQLFLWHVAA